MTENVPVLSKMYLSKSIYTGLIQACINRFIHAYFTDRSLDLVLLPDETSKIKYTHLEIAVIFKY